MPESVKITDLPALSAVQPGDIVPIVPDPTIDGSQTSSATAAQIAALGGGPPGVNTVSTDKLMDGAVTAPKVGFTGPDKIITRTASGAGPGVEAPCTPYARGLLATDTGAAARAYLDALQTTNNPTFTGQVGIGLGTVQAPALINSSDPGTGLYFPSGGALAFASGNLQTWRIENDGTVFTNVFQPENVNESNLPTGVMLPHIGARAFVVFNGQTSAAPSFTIGPSARQVGTWFGRTDWTSIWDTTATKAAMTGIADQLGYNLSFPSTPTFVDSKGRGTFPAYNRGTERRANHTSPSDNRHWYWEGTWPSGSWQLTSLNVTGKWWIGYITLTSKTSANPILYSQGVSSINRTGTGAYTINFNYSMTDTNYGVMGSIGTASGFITIGTRTATSVAITVENEGGTLFDPTYVAVAIYR